MLWCVCGHKHRRRSSESYIHAAMVTPVQPIRGELINLPSLFCPSVCLYFKLAFWFTVCLSLPLLFYLQNHCSFLSTVFLSCCVMCCWPCQRPVLFPAAIQTELTKKCLLLPSSPPFILRFLSSSSFFLSSTSSFLHAFASLPPHTRALSLSLCLQPQANQ